ncbi:DUF4870 domain-containing protein [Candidatus Formimonas warabiya]|uniref:DUF4870 domain-containing protein n=1 Tax=Formimonas warabiya TaxID=1761012 RepID=A0A3G1KRG6_FORW1|nr:DUF4870 domain-containing protein [Candidatus Formimonas warabiya]ATW25048.1 hypothetical protein DCMF_09905 [Candidatus Formimonas warabiya]
MSGKTVQPHRSSLGMDANVAVLVVYLTGVVLAFIPGIRYIAWLAPLGFFFVEKQSIFVRFHAMQAFMLSAVGIVFGLVAGIITVVGVTSVAAVSPVGGRGALGILEVLGMVVAIILLVFALIAMVKGYRYKKYKIPFVGGWAEKLASSAVK